MIRTGYDGGSRGDYDTGGFAGENHLEFVPLHTIALEWGGDVLETNLRLWLGKDYTDPLTVEGWFTTGHSSTHHICMDAPTCSSIDRAGANFGGKAQATIHNKTYSYHTSVVTSFRGMETQIGERG
eukprot:scaffold201305_cov47-Attheya_sp.AAC.2